MSEFLPETIRSHFPGVLLKLGLDPTTTQIVVSKPVAGELSSSCCVSFNGDTRIFVKFRRNLSEEGEFAEEAAAYFSNETQFYGEISERFGQMAAISCVPKCFCVVGDEPQFIKSNGPRFVILEDLGQKWRALDGKTAISVEKARAILERLGHFHAHSFALRDQRPDEFARATSKLHETLFLGGNTNQRRLLLQAIHDALKLLQRTLPENSQYVTIFTDFTLSLMETIENLLEDREFSVVTHGDLFPSNVLWNEEENSAIFVDFSGCRVASPVHDLLLFVLIALDRSKIQEHWEDLLRRYHISLCRKLQELGSDPLRIFPRSALDSQLLKHGKFAMTLALIGLPFYLNENYPVQSSPEKTHEDILGLVKEVRRQMSVKCKGKMLETIMEVIDRGYLS